MEEEKKKPKENYLALDLEMNQPSGKIIEVGIVIGNVYSGAILERKSFIVNPEEQLSPFIIELTKITPEMVDEGSTLLEAYNQIAELHKSYDCFCNAVCWGGGDSIELKKQLGIVEGWIFGRRWIDVKTLYVAHRIAHNTFPAGGLKRACKNRKVPFEGPAHRAHMDALNTFSLFHYYVKAMKNIL